MEKTNYSEKLKDPRWQKKRLQILQRDDWKCVLCCDSETTLHIHHKEYFGDPWDAPDDMLATLCEHCHGFISHIGLPDLLLEILGIKKFEHEDRVELFSVSKTGMVFSLQYDKHTHNYRPNCGIGTVQFDELSIFRNQILKRG